MTTRHYDPKNVYEGALLKEYEHWNLEVSWRQHTLGCFIIFSKRQDVRLESQLTTYELYEKQLVMRDMEAALVRHPLFRPDHFNYFQMGNALPILHYHGIPRYQTMRHFLGHPWFDVTWGNVPNWSHVEIRRQDVGILRNAILPYLRYHSSS